MANYYEDLLKTLRQKEEPKMSTEAPVESPTDFNAIADVMENEAPQAPMSTEPESAAVITPTDMAPEAPDEAETLSREIASASPDKVKEGLKKQIQASKPTDPYAEIKAQLEELQKGSKESVAAARKKDALFTFLDSLNRGLSQYDAASAARAAGQQMKAIKSESAKTRFEEMAKGDIDSEYKKLLNKLGLKKSEVSAATEKEYKDRLFAEKEKDRELKRELAAQDAAVKIKAKQLEADKKYKLTEGQKALDKAYAKDYADYVAGGGFAQAKGDISKLDKVLEEMEKNKDMFTGPVDTLTETLGGFEAVRAVTNPRLQDLKDRLEQIIQQDLRKTLGAQFTEKEGKLFMERSFNPKLGAKENIDRLRMFVADVKKRAEQKDRSAKYFEKHGTLQGFKGDTTAPEYGDKVRVQLPSGQVGTINKNKLDAFKKKYPDAKILE